MRVLNFSTITAATTLLLGSATTHGLVIDNFVNPPPQTVQVVRPSATGSSQVGPDAANILGGFRDILITGVTGPTGLDVTAEVIPSGILSVANDPGVSSVTNIIWDGNDSPTVISAAGLGSVDLTSGGATGIFMTLPFVDLNTQILFLAISNAGTRFSTFSNTFTTAVSDFFIPFSSFTGTADFTQIGFLSLRITGPAGVDTLIDFVETRAAPPAGVPEPASIALVGLGLAGLGVLRRRRHPA